MADKNSNEVTKFVHLEQKLHRLTESNRRLTAQLERAHALKVDLVDAVYKAALDGISQLEIPPVPEPKPQKHGNDPECAVAVLGDWQVAKVTKSYNSRICEKRIEMYADKLMHLTEIQRAHHPVPDLHVWLGGDLVEGELVFPGQAAAIDSSLYTQVTTTTPRILCNFLRKMLANFERIHVVGVIGNHGIGGRSRRDFDPTTNADRMVYRICQQIMASEKRITWQIPDQEHMRDWYAVDEIGRYRCLLAHGHQIRGYSGLPWYGFFRRIAGWRIGGIDEPFHDAMMFHYHQPTRMTLNTVTVRVNGTVESDSEYAAEQLSAVGRPAQWLLFVHPNVGVTAEYCVWLDGRKLPKPLSGGSVQWTDKIQPTDDLSEALEWLRKEFVASKSKKTR